MKRFFLTAFLLLALVRLSPAQPSNTFLNNGSIICPPANPPQIDATNFINNGTLSISFLTQLAPFGFFDVQNYTNRGTLSCNTGFIFNNAPSTNGFARMSASFGNGNGGNISVASATNLITLESTLFSTLPLLEIEATNIVNTGTLDIGTSGNITVDGMNVNLSRGTLHVEGFDDNSLLTNSFSDIGINDNYWGVGLQTNVLGLFNLELLPPFSPSSPDSKVVNSNFQPTFAIVTPPNASAYANGFQINASNVIWQVVYVNTNLVGISTAVRFEPTGGFSIPVIQWEAVLTNILGGGIPSIVTNDLYLSDTYGFNPTNNLVTNSFTFSGTPQLAPYNYAFSRSFTGYTNLALANIPFDAPTIFASGFPATNSYAAYGVTLAPVTAFPDPALPNSTVTNTPGRIEISAGTSLDLTGAKIVGPNYLDLVSTNQFVGSAGATIVSPYMGLNLGTTNGLLTVSNLVPPTVARFSGPITMYSARWTNIVNGFTNAYHILIVDAEISPTSVPLVLNCQFRSTNVVISDILNINSNLLVNASSLTITSNNSAAANPFGELNLFSSDIFWSSSLPVLQSLTNFGYISSSNSTYFFAASGSPYYATNAGLFSSFVNHGVISSAGDSIGANYVENSGVGTSFASIGFSNSAGIFSSIGGVYVQAVNALLANASILAPDGDISITTGNLTITNHTLQASGLLSFSVSNNLTDGGAASSNFWTAGDGMNLFVKPVTGDFLGTTVTLTSPAGLEVDNIWSGLDKGPVESGFLNNGAMGHLILNGGNSASDFSSQFFFGGPDSTNHYAIYVDLLDLTNGAANRNDVSGAEFFTTFRVAPNFTIYYADAVIGTFDISEKLDGANGGSLIWVPSYAGIFSSTNLVYPVGVTNKLNRALVESTDIDSNGNGVANAFDSAPIYTSYDVNLTVTLTNLPPKVPVLSWSGLANSTNIVFFKTNLTSATWTVLTNFVQGPANGIATVIDRGRTNSAGYYKVQVIAAKP